MATYTLLQLTQNILSALNSDAVNSIGDTEESMQVANVIQTAYFNMISRAMLPEHEQIFQLVNSNSYALPVLMNRPQNVSKVDWIKYFDTNVDDGDDFENDQYGAYSQHDVNTDLVPSGWTATSTTSNTIGLGTITFTVAAGLNIAVNNYGTATSGTNSMSGLVVSYSGTTLVMNMTTFVGSGTYATWVIAQNNAYGAAPGYQYVTILPVKQFLDMVNDFNPTESDVFPYTFSEQGNNFTFYYKNDHQPRYCTCISDQFFLFDTYDATQDSTLQGSKTLCFGQIVPSFVLEDNFIPDLQDYEFPLLLNEAKSLAFYELKQTLHQKAEQEVKRQWSNVSKIKSLVDKPSYFDQLPNFGRRIGTGGYAVGYPQSYSIVTRS